VLAASQAGGLVAYDVILGTASVVVAGCLNESAFHLADEYVDAC